MKELTMESNLKFSIVIAEQNWIKNVAEPHKSSAKLDHYFLAKSKKKSPSCIQMKWNDKLTFKVAYYIY